MFWMVLDGPIPTWEVSDFPNLVPLSFERTPKATSRLLPVMETLLSPAFTVEMKDTCKMCFLRACPALEEVIPSSSTPAAWDRALATQSHWEHGVCCSLAQHFMWDNSCVLFHGAQPLQCLQEPLADSSKQVAER